MRWHTALPQVGTCARRASVCPVLWRCPVWSTHAAAPCPHHAPSLATGLLPLEGDTQHACMEQGMCMEQMCMQQMFVEGMCMEQMYRDWLGMEQEMCTAQGRRAVGAGRLMPAALILPQHQQPHPQIPAPLGGQGKSDKSFSSAHELQKSGPKGCSQELPCV